jgi:hypothetical protein
MRRVALIVASFLLVACAGGELGALPDDGDFDGAVADAASEIAVHVQNLHLATSMRDVGIERVRYQAVAGEPFSRMRTHLVSLDGCVDAASRNELWQFMRGLEATERGYLAALEGARAVDEARAIGERYSAGADELFARISFRWASTGCATSR